MTGIANIALLSEETGRIFGLDAQLLFDILIQGLAVFLLFIFLTYVLINPVRKVLEDKKVTRLGDTKPRKIDVRIIVATNQNQQSLVQQGLEGSTAVGKDEVGSSNLPSSSKMC